MTQHGRADTDGNAADRGDDRLLIPGQFVHEVDCPSLEAAAKRRTEKIADIIAGAERAG